MKIEDSDKPMAASGTQEEGEGTAGREEDQKCGQFTCLACREARIYCEKTVPCARCVRLGIQCVPQNRGRGRPRGNPKKARRSSQAKNAAVDSTKASKDAKKKKTAHVVGSSRASSRCSGGGINAGPPSPCSSSSHASDDSSWDDSGGRPCYHSGSDHEEAQWKQCPLPPQAQSRVDFVHEHSTQRQLLVPAPYPPPAPPPGPLAPVPLPLPHRDQPCVANWQAQTLARLARPLPLSSVDDNLRSAYAVCAGALTRLLTHDQLDFNKANFFRDGLHLHFDIYSGFKFSGDALLEVLERCRNEYLRNPRGPTARLLMPGDALSQAESAADSAWVVDLLTATPGALTVYLRSSLRGARSDRQVWCNERMSELVMSSRELCAATLQMRTTIMHVLTRVLHPATQDGFFVALTEAMFSPGRAERNVVVKLLDRNMRAFRCLVTIRAVLHCYPGDTETAIRFLPLKQLVSFGSRWTEVGAVERETEVPGQWGSVVDGTLPEGEGEVIPTAMVKEGQDPSDTGMVEQQGSTMRRVGTGAEYVDVALPPQLTGSMEVVEAEGEEEEQFMSLLDTLGPLFDPHVAGGDGVRGAH